MSFDNDKIEHLNNQQINDSLLFLQIERCIVTKKIDGYTPRREQREVIEYLQCYQSIPGIRL